MQKKPHNTEKLSSLPDERRQAIVMHLAMHGRVVSRALAQDWSISEDTIRRDIRELDDAGLLRRVHGGALPRSPQLTPYANRAANNVDEKSRLGARGASAIADGMTVLLYGGTTILEAARHLRVDLAARIVTNDPRIALEAASRERVETILIGGRILPSSQLVVGSKAVDDIRALRADVCLIGACGLHAEFGLGINDVEESALQRAFVMAASEVVALVTADKLQTVAPFCVTPATTIAWLITSVGVPPEVLTCFRDLGLRVDCV